MNFYSLLSFFSFIVSLYVGIYVLLLNKKAQANILFFITCVLIAIWDFSYIFIYPEPNRDICMSWYKITSIGWATFVSFAIHFLLVLSKNKKLLKNKLFIFFLYAPALIFLTKAFYGGFLAIDFDYRNGMSYEIQDVTSVWYYSYIFYYVIYFSFGFFHLKKYAANTNLKKEKIQANIIFYTVLFLVLASTFTNILLPVLRIHSIPAIAQILITSWMFAIYYSIVKYKFLTITAEAVVGEIISEMKELLFFIDKDHKVLKINKFTEETVPNYKENIYFEDFFVEKDESSKLIERALTSRFSATADFSLKSSDTIIPVRLNITSLTDQYDDNFGCIAVGQDIRDNIRLKNEIEERKKTETELKYKNTQITDSIKYARKIQESLLPSWEDINKISKKNFVLYKPKDVVSGDFYWYHKSDKYIFLAVVDCTGHGVPGAFMSIIGNSLLTEIVEEKKGESTSKILQKLNELLFKKLNYKAEAAFYENDGLEISLVRIDLENKEIVFSGTNQTVLIVENSQLAELEGDIYSIGGCYQNQNISFIEKTYQYKNDIILYMFTDGYYDQLGGINKKKIGFNNLKNIVLNNYSLPFEKQRESLLEFHETWKGNNSQTDDILVLGINIG